MTEKEKLELAEEIMDVEEDTLDLMRCDKRHLLEFNLGLNQRKDGAK